MASAATDSHSILQKLINNLSSDLRQLSNETKKKYPPIKEVQTIFKFLENLRLYFRQQKLVT
jgi:hypothetical protein